MKATSTLVGVMCALVLNVLLFVAFPLFSQTANGRILGTVKDQSGGAIAGAKITIVDVQRGIERAITTEGDGAYLAPNIIPGTYTLRAEFQGFRVYERQNILVEVGKDVAIDVVMQPGEQTQKITVTEAVPLIETTNATLGGTLSNQSINDLPISGRNYQNLLELRPGVVLQLGNNSDGGGPAATNGLRAEESNAYMIEGLAGKDPYTGQSVINNIGVNGDAASLLPLDAIQEFNQQFNPKAAYGYSAGSTVSVGLKAGTNSLHGTAYGFFRNNALDAKNYFNPPGIQINDNVRQFGATVGGPIKKDKLFFFAGYGANESDGGKSHQHSGAFHRPFHAQLQRGRGQFYMHREAQFDSQSPGSEP
jgi:Carboxypeptidase regulatory-like domain